jgi:hypothetical protein
MCSAGLHDIINVSLVSPEIELHSFWDVTLLLNLPDHFPIEGKTSETLEKVGNFGKIRTIFRRHLPEFVG